MGWGNCGEDSRGRSIGYCHEAVCDHLGCDEKIDRGLSYACGGMHGQNEGDCEGYFCGKHLWSVEDPHETLHQNQLCEKCKHEWNAYLVEDLIEEIKQLKEDSVPKLNNWAVTAGVNHNWREAPNSYTPPELITQHLCGIISDDILDASGTKRFFDGDFVTTSTIVGKKGDNVITRSGTEYSLGDVKSEYEAESPDAKNRLMNSLSEKIDRIDSIPVRQILK